MGLEVGGAAIRQAQALRLEAAGRLQQAEDRGKIRVGYFFLGVRFLGN